MQKIIVIVGVTATGKSAFAVTLAKNMNGEIISADSRQVYRGLDLLSGKITKKEMQGIPHHMLDIVSPKKAYTVADFKKAGEKILQDILSRNKTPIIVGGTGFYIDALVSGNVLPEVPPNQVLRKKLTINSASKNFTLLKKLDPNRAKTIDRHNNVRIIRAIEIAQAVGKVPVLKQAQSQYETTWIGLTVPDEVLKKKIHMRLQDRLKSGMLREAKKLHDSGISWKRMNELGLEVRYAAHFLQGKIGKEEMIAALEKQIWQYAKRQKTWFKRNKEIDWIDPSKSNPLPPPNSTKI
jgi:tRNA dimethylallyltransferase